MANEKHTPTPWFWMADDDVRKPRIFANGDGADIGKLITEVGNAEPWNDALDEWEANAALIVRAVNSHANLVAALKAIDAFWTEDHPEGPDGKNHFLAETNAIWRNARAALAQAGEK